MFRVTPTLIWPLNFAADTVEKFTSTVEQIMKIIELIKEGMLSIADSTVEPRVYVYPVAGGFQRDQEKLSNDVRVVGNDMKKAIKKYGSQQPYKSSSAK